MSFIIRYWLKWLSSLRSSTIFHKLPSSSWTPRKAGGVNMKTWEPRSWYRFQPRSSGPRTRSTKGKIHVPAQTVKQRMWILPFSTLYSIRTLNRLNDAIPHWGGQPVLLHLTTWMLISSRTTQKLCLTRHLAIPWSN